jgi:hypothetical protein
MRPSVEAAARRLRTRQDQRTGSLLLGFSLGLFVAARIGAIALLVMRTVLRGALTAGIAIGPGCGGR